jgi:hypothetical protein
VIRATGPTSGQTPGTSTPSASESGSARPQIDLPVKKGDTVEGLVDVDGQDIHARCSGTGSPTVVYMTVHIAAGPRAARPCTPTHARPHRVKQPGREQHTLEVGRAGGNPAGDAAHSRHAGSVQRVGASPKAANRSGRTKPVISATIPSSIRSTSSESAWYVGSGGVRRYQATAGCLLACVGTPRSAPRKPEAPGSEKA